MAPTLCLRVQWAEMRELLVLWFPTALQALTVWLRPLVLNLFMSANIRNSTLPYDTKLLDEDAVGLALISYNLMLFVVAYGSNGAIDSTTSVAFGHGDRKEVLCVLLRQMLLLAATGVLLVPTVLTLAPAIYHWAGIDVALAERTIALLGCLAMAVPGDYANDAISRWMRGQKLHSRVGAASVLGVAVNLVANLSLAGLSDPTKGPIFAIVAQSCVMPVFLLTAYAMSSGPVFGSFQDLTWADVSRGFGQHLRIAIFASLWMCAELWAWQVPVLEASRLGPGNAAAFTLLSSTYAFLICTFPVSLATSTIALVGEALGAGRTARAERIQCTASLLALVMVFCYAAPVFLMRTEVAEMLGGGVWEVKHAYLAALPLILAMHFLDGLYNTFKTWLIVRKQQATLSAVTLVVYYTCGLPLGYLLAFRGGWGLRGVYSGLAAAVLVACAYTGVLVTRDMLAVHSAGEEGAEDQGAEEGFARGPRPGDELHSKLLGPRPDSEEVGCAATSQSKGQRYWWLLAGLAPGMLAFAGSLSLRIPAGVVRLSPAKTIQDTSSCTWSSAFDFYTPGDYYTVGWNVSANSYGWEVAIKGPEANTKLSRRMDLLKLGYGYDVYDVPYPALPGDIEVGWALWLRPIDIEEPVNSNGVWTERSVVGTRVNFRTHTTCACQFITGDANGFNITEHARAQMNFTPPADGSLWYLNKTRNDIHAIIEQTCRPLLDACPSTNATAFATWDSKLDPYWVKGYGVAPWVETHTWVKKDAPLVPYMGKP